MTARTLMTLTRAETTDERAEGQQLVLENSLIIGLAVTLGVAVAVSIGFLIFVSVDAGDARFSKNVSPSMEPTLLVGDFFTSRRLPRTALVPAVRRGDVIVFQFPPDKSKEFVKRIVGLPGDTLEMRERQMLLNGHPMAEPYVTASNDSIDPAPEDFRWQRRYLAGAGRRDTAHYRPSRDNWGPLVVPHDSVFMLGDRRDQSLDSRYFGFVSVHEIIASVRRIYFSRDESRSIRWSRFGKLVH
jgi:signal peptidase I